MSMIKCRHFTGYKPCNLNQLCNDNCPSKDLIQNSILIIHLGAMGAVLRSTALLPAIKRKFPKSKITWVTDSPSHLLLRENPLIDLILTTNFSDLLQLSALEFEVAFVIDKSLKASGVLRQTHADLVFGFQADALTGTILPANKEANELWEVGLNDELKFFINKKTENQLVHESLALGNYLRDEYILNLSQEEIKESKVRKMAWISHDHMETGNKSNNDFNESEEMRIIGINTGCSDTLPAKKLSVQNHIDLILKLKSQVKNPIVLLGGPEDTQRNIEIANQTGVILSPTDRGLRDGIISVQACDIVISGDSLGMHMAIALKKHVIAWFGPTCAHEIDLYGRGEKVLSAANCGPCWKRSCNQIIMCYDLVSLDLIVALTHKYISESLLVDEFNQPNESTV